MPKIVTPLSPTAVDKAKPKDKEYFLPDGDGLYLRVRPTGAKSWIFRYTHPHTNKQGKMSFGGNPDLGLADARSYRHDARQLLAQGIDPKTHRNEQRQTTQEAHSNTFSKIASRWFEVKKHEVSTGYAEDIWRSLELHVLPELSNTPIHAVTAPQVIKILKPLEAKGTLETAKRVIQRLNEIMTFAVNTGLINANPLSGISKAFKKPKKKNLPTIPPDRLPEFMLALSRASIKITTRCLIEWQLHTIVRPGEAAQARWDEIDMENQIWLAPDETMKMKEAHKIPLSPQALNLLEVMKPISGNREYIFPGDHNPKHHASTQTANAAIKRMGYKGILVAHGLRSIASTYLNEQEFNPDAIEAALAHKDSNEVRAAYNRSDYLIKRRELMNEWSSYINSAARDSISLSTMGNLTND